MMRKARLMRELEMLSRDPPPGVAVWPSTDKDGVERNDVLDATVQGPPDSPYEAGAFKMRVTVPGRYPHEPPGVQFVTKVYHPNVDGAGRICLDSLKMPPKGAWQPSLNIGQVLSQIRLLLAEPNPDDPLMPEISEELRNDPTRFRQRAKEHTERYAAVVDASADADKPADAQSAEPDAVQDCKDTDSSNATKRKNAPSQDGNDEASKAASTTTDIKRHKATAAS
ncbi:Ubiquitin-conjugating enzyme E2 T [Hondaea fermentalgiana]|uniref:E2 ubiquitin-conjugating enzyme n=1 Tax=Hondaea fermentalgiana TaxID=2315210 RepID=A0A2R5G8Z1_9STRA|nr:Ubiquitin-conjugating enzyme E2 T [Hondaea fermentalgiana]|eukprot:GBG27470.1 Ubiquitin-conjugating enzyme E2 T [Hondaea fermentalgiana]